MIKKVNQKKMENYADLILQRGVGLQIGDVLVLEKTSVTAIEFLRILERRAYELGAKDVVIHFADQELTRIRLENADIETLQSMPDWWVESMTSYSEGSVCFLRLENENPDGLSSVPHEKIAVWKHATTAPLKKLNFLKKENLIRWSASAVPGIEWAKKVFPNLSEEEAVNQLWNAIFDACYVTEQSGTEGWDRHIRKMQETSAKINALHLRKLHFTNALGTDITMSLCDDGIFTGGICHCPEPDGIMFAPNIPTEEILATPHKMKVNGVVYSSMPFIHAGNIVDGMRLVFQDGKVTEYSAEVGEEIVKGILETDEGASRVGEIALVPFDSPIKQSGLLFYNTLFDENAACHIALGAGYSDVIMGEDRSSQALEAKGLNLSALHVDFMFGTADLCCVGICEDGTEVEFFKNGNFNL